MIPIRWLLTVDSEMAFLPFPFGRCGCACFVLKLHALQEKFIAKLVNSKVNFTRKTDIVVIAL